MVPTETGGAVDDAYLYRFVEDEYLLVVNAVQPAQGLGPLPRARPLPRRRDDGRDRRDRDGGPAGPDARATSWRRCSRERRPARAAAQRAEHRRGCRRRFEVTIGRTGYTGEPRRLRALRRRRARRRSGTRWSARAPCPSGSAPATPCGSRPACRSTATSWASTPTAWRSRSSPSRWRSSPSASRRSRASSSAASRCERQQEAYVRIVPATTRSSRDLPRLMRPVALTGPRHRALRRSRLQGRQRPVGWVTSGTSVPYWQIVGEGLDSRLTDEQGAARHRPGLHRQRHRRGRRRRGRHPRQPRAALVVPYHARSDAPPVRAADRLRLRAAGEPSCRAATRRRRRACCSTRRSPTRVAAAGVHQPHTRPR